MNNYDNDLSQITPIFTSKEQRRADYEKLVLSLNIDTDVIPIA